MKKIIASTLLLFAITVSASTVDLGGAKINLPAPEGYIEASPKMEKVWPLVEAAQGDNHVLAFFIPREEEAAALGGEIPNLDRNINIQTRRKFEGRSIDAATFELVKVQMRKLIASRQVNDLQAKEIERFNGNLKNKTSLDINMQQTDNISLPPHINTADEFGYSEISTIKGSLPDGTNSTMQTTATAVALLIKGKILYCNVAGGANDLDWTRKTASRLAAEIRQANLK
ncbi:hypothetical protein KSF73_13225 [Burkholderiaceae bacterium DAT-1]|nr:hypothetical protein [Burkholderiaceae bacterium DAT-1]